MFEKALLEPGFCELYAEFSKRLQTELPEFMVGTVAIILDSLRGWRPESSELE